VRGVNSVCALCCDVMGRVVWDITICDFVNF
jgi:hypothetical protein